MTDIANIQDTVICGDCLDVMKDMPDGCVDLVLTDPPYGTTQCKWDSIIPLEPMWDHLKRVAKPDTAIVLMASQPYTTVLIASNLRMFKYDWVWDKGNTTGFLNANKMPLRKHEEVLVFSAAKNGLYTYNPQKTKGLMRKKGGYHNKQSDVYGDFNDQPVVNDIYHPTSIIDIGTVFRNANVHPTQKPVALMEYLTKTYSNEGDVVLDFTCGSGTTGVACVRMNRRFVCIDDAPDYCKIAEKRIQDERDKYGLFEQKGGAE